MSLEALFSSYVISVFREGEFMVPCRGEINIDP